MAHIRDIDISKLNIDESLKPYIAEALIELDDLFDYSLDDVVSMWDELFSKLI